MVEADLAQVLPVPCNVRPDDACRVAGDNASFFVECRRYERPHPDDAAVRDGCSLHEERLTAYPYLVGHTDVLGVIDALASIAVKNRMGVSWANLDTPSEHAIGANLNRAAFGEDDRDVSECAALSDDQAVASAPFRRDAPFEASPFLDQDLVLVGGDSEGCPLKNCTAFDGHTVVLAEDLNLRLLYDHVFGDLDIVARRELYRAFLVFLHPYPPANNH